MADADLRDEVDRLAPWFHNIDLGHGIHTAPDHFLGDYPRFKFARFADALPADWTQRQTLRATAGTLAAAAAAIWLLGRAARTGRA